MVEKTICLYPLSELDKKTRQAAIDKHRYINVDYTEWYDFIEEDFHNALQLLGFSRIQSTFSGFYSQGDGASFTGQFYLASPTELPEGAQADYGHVKPVAGAIATLRDLLKNHDSLAFTVERGTLRYVHERSVYIDNVNIDDEAADGIVEETLSNMVRSLCSWYYTMLTESYDYLTSDEAVADTIENNEMLFTENGRIC